MIFDWSANLVPQDIAVLPPRATVGLSRSLNGFTQSAPAIRPPFGLKLTFGNLFGDEVKAWRAMMALFEGRANAVRVPLFDLWHRAKDSAIGAHLVPWSDGATFSDGAMHLADDLEGVIVSGAQGQRTITADFGQYGQLLEAGLYFGLGEHPYIARRVWWEGSVATIETTPSFRSAYVNEPLKLKPTMIAGLIDDDQGELMLRRARYGAPSLELVERFV